MNWSTSAVALGQHTAAYITLSLNSSHDHRGDTSHTSTGENVQRIRREGKS